MIRVLFVCMGNICRSPSAEGVFRSFVESEGLGEVIEIDSAGTIAYHAGEPADARMRAAAAERGYSLDSIARQVTRGDFDTFDLIVAMDRDNYEDLVALVPTGQSKVHMLGSYLPGGDEGGTAPDVPDPYYGGPDGFALVLDMLEQACPGMLAHCRELSSRSVD